MAGLLGTGALIQTDINFILQIVMFIIIAIGIFYKIQRKYKIHGSIMGIALVLHIISFAAVMGPSFSKIYNYTSDFGVQITWIHAVPGAIAMILGIILVTAWAIRPSNIAGCIRRKRIMDVTVLLWLVSLIFGIATYLSFYTTLL